ncbi:MAG: hypothetical protein IPM85_08540 [Chitinophagaceae bacterium]|nr:hypothetical protein [Chitinophagaceae bacterium]
MKKCGFGRRRPIFPLTGQPIPLSELFNRERYDIDHIIPHSRYLATIHLAIRSFAKNLSIKIKEIKQLWSILKPAH